MSDGPFSYDQRQVERIERKIENTSVRCSNFLNKKKASIVKRASVK